MRGKVNTSAPGAVYHVIGKGNPQGIMFRDELDFRVFLNMLLRAADRFACKLYAFCLLHNQYHLMLSASDKPVAAVAAWLNKQYEAYYTNRYHNQTPLFSRKAVFGPLKDRYELLHASRYIHRIPVDTKLVKEAGAYKWSSYGAYSGAALLRSALTIDTGVVLRQYLGNEAEKRAAYCEYVEASTEELVLADGA